MDDLLTGVRRNTKHNHTTVTDYETLATYVQNWIDGTGHKFMVILGRPGILKSSTIKAAIGDEAHLWIEGDTGPLAFYRDLFLHRNQPIVMDDLKLTGQVRSLMQNLTDNYQECIVRWAAAKAPVAWTDKKLDEDRDDDDDEDEGRNSTQNKIQLPTKFSTASRVCWITNDVERLKDMTGLLDRSYIVNFSPPVSDVLVHCKRFVDSEIWQWACQHEKLLPVLSVRDLVQAAVDKSIGMNWKTILLNRYIDPSSPLGAYLSVMSNDKLKTATDRVSRFTKLCNKSRATYFSVQDEYRKLFPTPNLPRGRHVKVAR